MTPPEAEKFFGRKTVLYQKGGVETLRNLERNFSIRRSEISEAEQLGWLTIEERKPSTGRPATIARPLAKVMAAKLPPPRWMLERPIKFSHQKFAMLTVYASIKGGSSHAGFPGYIKAYQRTYPQAKSKNGACASCSRLLSVTHTSSPPASGFMLGLVVKFPEFHFRDMSLRFGGNLKRLDHGVRNADRLHLLFIARGLGFDQVAEHMFRAKP